MSPTATRPGEIAASILTGLKNLAARGLQASDGAYFAASAVHADFEMSVGAEAIRNGFYRELYGLQGKRNTWYTGATWHAHDSSLIWRFTEGLLPDIIAGT